jgi:hypothetical protein
VFFLGISKKLNIKREKEIVFASLIGIIISIGLPIFVFLFSQQASRILTEKNAEILESYLMIFDQKRSLKVIKNFNKIFLIYLCF